MILMQKKICLPKLPAEPLLIFLLIPNYILRIYFSKVAVGAVLSQEQHGKERFLGVKGRKCRVYEANYHSSKGEILALVYGLQKFDDLLRYKKFCCPKT